MEAMSFSKAVAEMEKVVESAPATKPVRWDHWSKVTAIILFRSFLSYLDFIPFVVLFFIL
jgi:hypothetical protein